MLAWFAFFMLLIGGLLYGFLSPDLRNSNEQNMPYARAAIMQLVSRHQGAVKLATLNMADLKVQLNLSDTDFATNETYGKNLFTAPTQDTSLVGVLSASKMKAVMPSGLNKSFNETHALPLENYHTYNSVFVCLDEMGEITATCGQNKSYVLTYGYQQDWWDERAKKDNLWQKALAKEVDGGMCGVLSCTSVSCQIKSGGKLTPFPNALYNLLVNNALIHTGGKYPLAGLTVCLTQVSVGPDKSTPPVYGDGSSDIGVECVKDEDCTEPGKTYCNPALFKCEALTSETTCAIVNPNKPYFIEGLGCVECTSNAHCPEMCETDVSHACKSCAELDHTKPVYNHATGTCVECVNDTHCSGTKPACDHGTCASCASIDIAKPYYVAGMGCVACTPATQNADCPPTYEAAIQCPAGTYYHTGIGCLGCAPENCTSFMDADGRTWVASNTTLSVANAKAFCASAGGVVLTTREPMCGGPSVADCQSSSIYSSLRNYFYVNGVAHGGVQRTVVWTADDNTPTAGQYWYVNLTTTNMGYTTQTTKYYALCTGIITPPMICDGTAYTCRTPASDAECATYTPATPVYNSATGLCEDCSGDTPVNDNGTCRAPNSDTECAQFYPTEPRYAPGVGCVLCTPATQGEDCVSAPPSLECDATCTAYTDARGVHWKIGTTPMTQYESVNFCRSLGGHLTTQAEITPVMMSEFHDILYTHPTPAYGGLRDYSWLDRIDPSNTNYGYYMKTKDAAVVRYRRDASMNNTWGMYAFCIIDGASSVCDATSYTCRPAQNTPECAATLMDAPIYDTSSGKCRAAQDNTECAALGLGRPYALDGACVECTSDTHCPEACENNTCTTCAAKNPATPVYSNGACVECAQNSDCPSGSPLCDTATHTCYGGMCQYSFAQQVQSVQANCRYMIGKQVQTSVGANCHYTIKDNVVSGSIHDITMTEITGCDPGEYCYLRYFDVGCDTPVDRGNVGANEVEHLYGTCLPRTSNNSQCNIASVSSTFMTELDGCPGGEYCYLRYFDSGCANPVNRGNVGEEETEILWGTCLARTSNNIQCNVSAITAGGLSETVGCPGGQYCYLKWEGTDCSTPINRGDVTGPMLGACIPRTENSSKAQCPIN